MPTSYVSTERPCDTKLRLQTGCGVVRQLLSLEDLTGVAKICIGIVAYLRAKDDLWAPNVAKVWDQLGVWDPQLPEVEFELYSMEVTVSKPLDVLSHGEAGVFYAYIIDMQSNAPPLLDVGILINAFLPLNTLRPDPPIVCLAEQMPADGLYTFYSINQGSPMSPFHIAQVIPEPVALDDVLDARSVINNHKARFIVSTVAPRAGCVIVGDPEDAVYTDILEALDEQKIPYNRFGKKHSLPASGAVPAMSPNTAIIALDLNYTWKFETASVLHALLGAWTSSAVYFVTPVRDYEQQVVFVLQSLHYVSKAVYLIDSCSGDQTSRSAVQEDLSTLMRALSSDTGANIDNLRGVGRSAMVPFVQLEHGDIHVCRPDRPDRDTTSALMKSLISFLSETRARRIAQFTYATQFQLNALQSPEVPVALRPVVNVTAQLDLQASEDAARLDRHVQESPDTQYVNGTISPETYGTAIVEQQTEVATAIITNAIEITTAEVEKIVSRQRRTRLTYDQSKQVAQKLYQQLLTQYQGNQRYVDTLEAAFIKTMQEIDDSYGLLMDAVDSVQTQITQLATKLSAKLADRLSGFADTVKKVLEADPAANLLPEESVANLALLRADQLAKMIAESLPTLDSKTTITMSDYTDEQLQEREKQMRLMKVEAVRKVVDSFKVTDVINKFSKSAVAVIAEFADAIENNTNTLKSMASLDHIEHSAMYNAYKTFKRSASDSSYRSCPGSKAAAAAPRPHEVVRSVKKIKKRLLADRIGQMYLKRLLGLEEIPVRHLLKACLVYHTASELDNLVHTSKVEFLSEGNRRDRLLFMRPMSIVTDAWGGDSAAITDDNIESKFAAWIRVLLTYFDKDPSHELISKFACRIALLPGRANAKTACLYEYDLLSERVVSQCIDLSNAAQLDKWESKGSFDSPWLLAVRKKSKYISGAMYELVPFNPDADKPRVHAAKHELTSVFKAFLQAKAAIEAQ